MGTFATEFQIYPAITRADFLAMSLSWVRGMRHSSLLINEKAVENYGDELVFTGDRGERFSIKEIKTDDGFVIGSRYDLLDEDGRNWRTECVLTNTGDQASLRVRTQSILGGIEIEGLVPKKPFFIKACMQDAWGALDGEFEVNDQAKLLSEDDVDLAQRIVVGDHTSRLPILYLSAKNDGLTNLDATKLAYDLGGVAHIVVEPSRTFSFNLRQNCDDRNPYGGTVGFSAPSVGVFRRFFLGGILVDAKSLEGAVRRFAVSRVSAKNAELGFEWQDLQQEYSRRLRQRSADLQVRVPVVNEYDELFKEELTARDETIANLRAQIKELTKEKTEIESEESFIPQEISSQLGPELYAGEFSDRLRALLMEISSSETPSMQSRTTELVKRLMKVTEYSGGGASLNRELKAASRRDRKAVEDFISILTGLGYNVTDDGKHHKATPRPDYFGLGVITLPKTPSDWRSAKNLVSQIVEALGLSSIKRD